MNLHKPPATDNVYVTVDEDDYDNTNDGSGDDIINGGGSDSSNGRRVSVVM
jgi:hypothetical protein